MAEGNVLQPHQQRVVEEKAELDDRLAKLTVFVGSDFFKTIDQEEQIRLNRQRDVMQDLSLILGSRIEAF